MHHAFPLGIIQGKGDSNYLGWFLSNYIYIYYSHNAEDLQKFNFLVDYTEENPCISMTPLFHKDISDMEMKDMLIKWIKYCIDNEIGVEMLVDFFYLRNSDTFLIEHYMHEILITGCNGDNIEYWTFFGNVFKKRIARINEIVPYNSEVYYGDGIGAKEWKRIENNIIPIDKDSILTKIKEYFDSVYVYDGKTDKVRSKSLEKCSYGFQTLNYLKREIMTSNEVVDIRPINLQYEHKKGIFKRLVLCDEVDGGDERWKDLINKWKILLNISLKYNILSDRRMGKSDPKELQVLCDCVKRCEEQEYNLLSEILA